MDIFEMAAEGMKNQQKQIEEEKIEAEAEDKAKKKYKIDIFEALAKIAQKDYGWLGRNEDDLTAEDKRKGFEPFIANMFMSKMFPKYSKGRSLSVEDKAYFHLISKTNELLNKNIFWVSKEMSWLLACSVNDFDMSRFDIENIKMQTAGKAGKLDPKIIKYLCDALWSSESKIRDMINLGFITDEDLKAIKADLDTLEQPKKKK